jgi:RNA polymerase sigma-70 factor (ECF subfamily)
MSESASFSRERAHNWAALAPLLGVGVAVLNALAAPWRLPLLGARSVEPREPPEPRESRAADEGGVRGAPRSSPPHPAAAGASPRAPHDVPPLGEIFRDYAPFVWRGLRRLGVPESDVEDVSQEVFVVIHRKLSDFEGRSSLRTWIYGICARTASDYRRSGRVRREVVTDTPPDAPQEGGQHDAVALKQARATLDRILDELDTDKRSVFVLYEIEELTMAEVAEAIGCPLQTAYSRLHAARKVVEAGVARAQLAAKVGA